MLSLVKSGSRGDLIRPLRSSVLVSGSSLPLSLLLFYFLV